MANRELTASPLGLQRDFNWVFLIELLTCGILTIFFLFYFNRLFATLISYGIRAYTWHQYRAYIDIQALQISLLGGRVFFKDIRYHGHNQTVLVHSGYITWRYWLRKVKEAEIFSENATGKRRSSEAKSSKSETEKPRSRSASLGREENGGAQGARDLPCRISIKISGVEAFLYNRSPGYDAVVDNVKRMQKTREGRQYDAPLDPDIQNIDQVGPKGTGLSGGSKDSDRDLKRNATSKEPSTPPAPSFLRIFPIQIDCRKAAAVLGNENTKAVIIAKVDSASGQFDAAEAGPLDIYKQIFRFEFANPIVTMRPNQDYRTPQLAMAARLKQEAQEGGPTGEEKRKVKKPSLFKRGFLHPLRAMREKFKMSSSSSIMTASYSSGGKEHVTPLQPAFPGQDRWQGLSRYLDDSQYDEHDEWDGVEYAKSSLIVDCPKVSMQFYWDIPGPVPVFLDYAGADQPEAKGDINGGLPPEYGIDLHVHGGTINYGPWADRQRINFQSIFFPASYSDAQVAKPLTPGDTRVNSVFKLYLCIEEDTTLRIPIREASKDWKWKGKAQALTEQGKNLAEKVRSKSKRKSVWRRRNKKAAAPTVRPFAWLDIKVYANTTVSYVMDMVAQHDGYQNKLGVDVKGSEISTSVNHGLLWRSGALTLDCDLGFPLSWNALRVWHFNIICHDLELFILRDHLFLITDVVADWGSGPPSDYFVFTPFRYLLNLEFRNFKLYLNTNDSNIINNPADLEDNHFVILYGQSLAGDITIPLDKFRPLQNEIFFDVKGRDLGLDLSLPPRNTIHTFLKANNVAKLSEVTLKGSHNLFTETSIALTDTLNMDIHGSKLTLYLYGFVLRHFMTLKDNYFGDYLHFKTLEEFQELSQGGAGQTDGKSTGQPTKRSNDLDVILSLGADDVTVLLPGNLYSAENNIAVDLAFATADLRFTNYYMELMVDFSPLSVAQGTMVIEGGVPVKTGGRAQLFIDAANIYGHRLFGLPPTEPTYVCHWDFAVGNIKGECSSSFLEHLVSSIRGLTFGMDDDENALGISQPPVIPDITFLRMKTGSIGVWLHVATEALLVRSGPISMDFNDWAGQTFSQRLQLSVPELVVACVDSNSASRHRTRAGEKNVVETHAYIQTALNFNMLRRTLHFSEERQKQQHHVWESDQRTNRTPFLLLPGRRRGALGQDPPAMPFPPTPYPLKSNVPLSSDRSWTSSSRSSGRSTVRRASSIAQSIASSRSIEDLRTRARSDHSPTLSRRGSQYASLPVASTTTRPPYDVFPSEEERSRRGLPPSSIAFSSPLAAPYFPLDLIEPDTSDVPKLPKTAAEERQSLGDVLPAFNDVLTKSLDENLSHTTLVIDVRPGIRAMFKPQAVLLASNLMDIMQPKRPEDLLDAFQVNVLSQILELQKRNDGIGKSIEFGVRLPAAQLRFINNFSSRHQGVTLQEIDQYDFNLDGLALNLRNKNLPQPTEESDSLSVHCTLNSIGLSVREKSLNATHSDVAVRAQIDDVLLWLVKAKMTSVHVSYRDFELATASRRVEYLASLVHRTTLLVDQLQAQFVAVDKQEESRLRTFAYLLTKAGADIPDPLFLTKPSYALRAAADHLRNHDSWKIISRFRHILQCLSSEQRSDIEAHLVHQPSRCPPDAEEKVLQSWDQWRSWDLAHVKKSFAMRKLYGNMAGVEKLPGKEALPVEVSVRAASTRLFVDPGPKQSGLNLDMLVLNLATSPPASPSGLMVLVDNQPATTDILLQANLSNTTLHLNWEICELVEDMLELFIIDKPQSQKQKDLRVLSGQNNKPVPQNFHVLVSTDRGAIVVDTINLRMKNVAKGLKASIVGAVNDDTAISAIVHTNTASTSILSKSKVLLRSTARAASLSISKENYLDHQIQTESWRVLGHAKEIIIELEEEVPGLLEVVDLAVIDEAAYLKEQIARFRKTKSVSDNSVSDESAQKELLKLPDIRLALLMDAYHVNIALLHSLSWNIYGRTGRVSAIPTLGRGTMFKLDFDLSEQKHVLRSNAKQNFLDIATLGFPPINGYVNVQQLPDRPMAIDFITLIEAISLDGAALYSLATALSKPEIFEAIEAMKSDIVIIQRHVEQTFPKISAAPEPLEPTDSNPILFGVDATLAGLKVTAIAPGKARNSVTAELTLALQSLKLKATNRSGDSQEALLFPELLANLGELGVFLTTKSNGRTQRCGNIAFGVKAKGTTQRQSSGVVKREYRASSAGLHVNLFAETASTIVDIVNHLHERIKDLDLSKEREYFRKLRNRRRQLTVSQKVPQSVPQIKLDDSSDDESTASTGLFTSAFAFELLDMQICWLVDGSVPASPARANEDLVFSFQRVDLSSKSEDGARLTIEGMQLQMTPPQEDRVKRSQNSALLPEIVFDVAYASSKKDRQLAFKAQGKSLDVLLEPQFILPANAIQRSITLGVKKFQGASASWQKAPTETATATPKKNPFSSKRLTSLVVDAYFAGAVVTLQGSSKEEKKTMALHSPMSPQEGRYGQFGDTSSTTTALRSPGLSVKVEYADASVEQPSLNVEVKVDGSSNMLYPSVVPLLMQISDSVKEVVQDKDDASPVNPPKPAIKMPEGDKGDTIVATDPSTLLGKTKLNVGLRICKQELTLSCQPIARVAATAKFEDIYLTMNSIRSQDHGHFFALSGVFEKLEVAVQHVYSRESTFSFDVDAVKLSVLNSKLMSGTSGISAILKIDPMRTQINARQLQDFLLFREIWIPPEIRQGNAASPVATTTEGPQEYLVQRYQQVAAAAAFPWNATIAIAEMSVDLELGQAIGKSSLKISKLWVSTKKDSDWEQNLCIGVEGIAIDSTGRMSGFVDLNGIKVRTSIAWPVNQKDKRQTPLIQASIGFNRLRVKAAADYQPFAVADIAAFEFIMYNVREPSGEGRDRLVAILDGEKVQAFFLATSAARGYGLVQAFERLVQENQAAYRQSLRDIEKFLRRQSGSRSLRSPSHASVPQLKKPADDDLKAPISLHTDVVLTLRFIELGVFPSTFYDGQIFKLEASDVQARFAAMLEERRIHSGLGMTLGQLSVALAAVSHPKTTGKPGEVTVEEVVTSAASSRGGTILRVPKVIASMQTWQTPDSNHIDYIFKSSFEGKVDVGWNYSRISFIRNMWDSHSRSLASRLGKPLPSNSAVKIQAEPSPPPNTTSFPEGEGKKDGRNEVKGEKITAVVNMPQSKYEYTALEPPIIDTPQLRDMGEATPPLEWIGLHRDRLPNVTHQVVIVGLLEVAKEVEDAYERILGSS